MSTKPSTTLAPLFHPAGIAVFGVSTVSGNLGRNIVDNLVRWRFAGLIVALGRRAGEVHGIPITAEMTAAALNGCDLAVILTPAATVPGILRLCGEAGIHHAVIETAGFSELGEQGDELEREVVTAARESGVRFLGPNCVGLAQLANGNVSSFAAIGTDIPPGDAAIVAQSGGVGLAIMRSLGEQGLGVGSMVTLGNKLDLDEVDIIEHLLTCEPVGRLVLYLESASRGRALCDLARHSEVPLIVHKVNRTAAATFIAQSHTAAAVNDDRIVGAAFGQAGIIRARDTEDVVLATQATRLPLLRGRRIALLSRSGGHAVIATDACADEGLELPPFSPELLADLSAIQSDSVIHRQNPLDFGDIFDFDKVPQIVERVIREPDVDGIALVIMYNRLHERESMARAAPVIARLCREHHKPIAVTAVVETPELAGLRGLVDLPVFDTPEKAVRVLGILARRYEARQRALGARPRAELDRSAWASLGAGTARVWSLGRSLAAIAAAGIPVVQSASPEEHPFAYPVVAKLSADSEQVVHKAALGMVHTNIGDATALDAARVAIREAAHLQGLSPGDVLVQPQLSGPPLFLGAKRDPSFGPVVLFGCGGELLELVGDAVVWPYPFTLGEIAHLYGQTRLPKLLGDGFDIAQLGRWLAGLGELLAQVPAVVEIDVNPILMTAHGPQAIDARVVQEDR